jgi:hypothetical protein
VSSPVKSSLLAAALAGVSAFSLNALAEAPLARESMQEISKQEYLARAARQFDAMDSNKDQKVTVEERRAFREKHYRAAFPKDKP